MCCASRRCLRESCPQEAWLPHTIRRSLAPLLDCCSQLLAEAQYPLSPAPALGATPTYVGVVQRGVPQGESPHPSSSLLLPSEAAREAYSPLPLGSGLHVASIRSGRGSLLLLFSPSFFFQGILAMGPLVLRHGPSGACPSCNNNNNNTQIHPKFHINAMDIH